MRFGRRQQCHRRYHRVCHRTYLHEKGAPRLSKAVQAVGDLAKATRDLERFDDSDKGGEVSAEKGDSDAINHSQDTWGQL